MPVDKKKTCIITLIVLLAMPITWITKSCADPDVNLDSNESYCLLELTDKNFASILSNSSLLVLTIYYPGCSHCKSLNNTTSELSNELHGQIRLSRMNAQKNESSNTLKKYKVSVVPALLIFDEGILSKQNER